MHEYAITKELLRIAREQAKKHGMQNVKTIKLILGELTGYEEEPLQFYFNELKIGGEHLSEATLVIEKTQDNTIKIVSLSDE